MTNQNYLEVQNDVVINVVVWDGNPDTWTPPEGSIMLVQETTPAIVWSPIRTDGVITDFELAEIMGAGDIGFTWDGTVCTTNQPKPAIPVTLPA